jgi:hypothetical protein
LIHVARCFVMLNTPMVGTPGFERHKTRGAIKPAGQQGAFPQTGRFARQQDERGLRRFFGVRVIAQDAPRDAVDHARVPLHQFAKRAFHTSFHVLAQQLEIIRHAFELYMVVAQFGAPVSDRRARAAPPTRRSGDRRSKLSHYPVYGRRVRKSNRLRKRTDFAGRRA